MNAMETIVATCPICDTTHPYGAELIGRYTPCVHCGARFYVEVPALGAAQGQVSAARPRQPEMTLDDLFHDTQKGTRFIIQSVRRQEDSIKRVRWLVIAALLLGLANLAGTVFLLLR